MVVTFRGGLKVTDTDRFVYTVKRRDTGCLGGIGSTLWGVAYLNIYMGTKRYVQVTDYIYRIYSLTPSLNLNCDLKCSVS
jgi:hypothetical protein